MVDGKAVTFDLLEHRHNNPDDYDAWEETDLKTLDKAWETLEEVFQQYPQVYDALKHISGCYNNTGIHAGGVIICNKPINHNGQVMMGSETAVLPILQFEMGDLDFFGFLNIMGNVNAGYMLGQAKAINTPTTSSRCRSRNSIMDNCNCKIAEYV